ncbi:50S ribosomal protein L13 [Heliophilum fasciatum]|uniref:Large ribosomal subunit protein uL13 n=1 Tax=Heliophilum fasciatum TaxID=35700 RepID=A0A4R2RNS0_9FIRM|nr:50S ribosomal protein L13 [Heliophilum fasciatum]MCW2277782.1 large subunit ribosomal protein L13 [Heliophilum fasciatum]TCP64724.1 LSU ribosomal protein L13P [Heliophilum fasciatum]
MRTFMAKANEIERKWYVVDATDKTLGRLASEVARLLRGKHKPIFTPHVDTGDHVIVINAEKVRLTGKKLTQKMYYHHSRYPGGMKLINYGTLLRTKPERAMEKAIRGMLPKNSLGEQMYRKLKVYAGPNHPHQAQQPEVFEITE